MLASLMQCYFIWIFTLQEVDNEVVICNVVSIFSSVSFATDVGENMKADCEKIISVERNAELDSTDSSDKSNDSDDSKANGQ